MYAEEVILIESAWSHFLKRESKECRVCIGPCWRVIGEFLKTRKEVANSKYCSARMATPMALF